MTRKGPAKEQRGCGGLPSHVTSETPGTSRPVTGAGSPIPPSRALKEPWEATESGSLDSSSWMDVRKYSDSIFLELEGPFDRPVCPFAYPAVSALHPAPCP